MTDRPRTRWDDPMHEFDTEQLLADWFEEEAPTQVPAVLVPNVIAQTALTRRRARWFVSDWWRDLVGVQRWPSLVPVAVGAGTVAALAVVLAVIVGGLPQQQESRSIPVPADAIVVSTSDDAAHVTIADAIAAAEPGDTVAIEPGEYRENLILDRDITLVGVGNADDIVLRPASGDEPIILIDGGDATLSNFTISGEHQSVNVAASRAVFEAMTFRGVGDQWWTFNGAGWDGFDQARPSILVELFGEAEIRDSLFDGGGEIEIRGSSTALIEDNTLVNGAAIFLNDADGATVVRNNSIIDSGRYSIESTSATELLIEGNTISQRDPGIAIRAIDLRGTIKDNTIDGANVGVQLGGRATPTIIGNSIDTDGVAFEVVEDVDAVITGNELCATNAIVAVGRDVDPPDVSDNTICEGVPVTFER